ncbi:YibE/F family protein [Vagococcus hydrophili]|uniref:YibE/F family protein n=1 Tax=Vagococcus hydrophili TaxID=2714947 RepID=A0A6G8APY9_9ENTE|nr:YibE/F family protein [Vagococcus hydrophili]QIL47141.1 YibE/F family protein [Vagococcus hydrophili]
MIQIDKKKKISLLILLFISSILIYQSFQFDNYQQPIGKIVSIKNISTVENLDEHGNHDVISEDQLNIHILNSAYKNKEISLINTYSSSKAKNQSYHKNEYVFLHLTKESENLTGNIIDLKRDHYLILLITLFLALLIIFNGGYGLRVLSSFILNGSFFILLFSLYKQMDSHSLLLLFVLFIPLLVSCSFLLTNGWNTKSKVAILSTLIGSLITFLLGFIVIELLNHQGLHYEEMELITRPPHILFLSSLLIGCVGAVMDVSMTIISALFELKETQKNISLKELARSGNNIGHDIMGPMINIMFFSYLSGSIPLILIFLRNEMAFNYTFSIVLSLEMARALVGSIGILLAIPISIKVTSFFLRKELNDEC